MLGKVDRVTRADAQHEPAAGARVQPGRAPGQQPRRPEGSPSDQRSHRDPIRHRGHGGQGGERLQGGPVRGPARREEVVEGEDAVEAEGLGLPGCVEDLSRVRGEHREDEPDLHGGEATPDDATRPAPRPKPRPPRPGEFPPAPPVPLPAVSPRPERWSWPRDRPPGPPPTRGRPGRLRHRPAGRSIRGDRSERPPDPDGPALVRWPPAPNIPGCRTRTSGRRAPRSRGRSRRRTRERLDTGRRPTRYRHRYRSPP